MNFRIWMIKVLLALGTVGVTTEVIGQVHRFVESSHVDGSGSVFTSGGRVKVDLREVRTEMDGAKGPIALSVLVMRDPKSGAYSWQTHTADPANPSLRSQQFNDSQAAFLKHDEFTDFMVLPTPLRLFVHQHNGRAHNMNEAVDRSLKEAGAALQPRGDVETTQGLRAIPLLAVGRDFTSNPMSVTVFDVMPKVTNVQWDGKYWTVTLQARRRAVVTLDGDYTVVSMRKVE
jgi:hypothetical protein